MSVKYFSKSLGPEPLILKALGGSRLVLLDDGNHRAPCETKAHGTWTLSHSHGRHY